MYEQSFSFVFLINLGLFFLTVLLVRLWALRRKNYWKMQNMPQIESKIFFGTFASTFIQRKCITETFLKIYKENEEDHVVGVNILHKPALLVRSHEIIKRILTEDKSFFIGGEDGHSSVKVENSINYKYIAEKQEMYEFLYKLESVLSSVTSEINESLINEIYSSEMSKIGQDLQDFCSKATSTDAKELVAYYMVDIIFKLIYNIDSNCLNDEKSSYRNHKDELFKTTKVTDWVWKKWNTKKNDFLWRENLIKIQKSEKEVELSVLMRALMEPCDQKAIEIKSLEKILRILIDKLRQFSSTLVFCMYELAKSPTVQEKLRYELKENFTETSHDCSYLIEANTFLHKVIQETLRLHPISSVLKRDCDFPDDEEEGYSLEPFYKYKVPRKIPFLIPVHAILKDEKFFSNPNMYNPARYAEKTHEILSLFSNHHLEDSNTTKFVVAVIKHFICRIIRNFKIKLSDDQNDSINYEPMSVMLLPNDPILISLEQI